MLVGRPAISCSYFGASCRCATCCVDLDRRRQPHYSRQYNCTARGKSCQCVFHRAGDVSQSGCRTTSQRPWKCEPCSVNYLEWSWWGASTNQNAELARCCNIYSYTATGPCDLGSIAHDHPAPDGCEVDYDDRFLVQLWGSPLGPVPHG